MEQKGIGSRLFGSRTRLIIMTLGAGFAILIIRLFVGPLLPVITQGNVIIRFLRTAGNTQVMGLGICIPVQ